VSSSSAEEDCSLVVGVAKLGLMFVVVVVAGGCGRKN
jgi:hypothetical protein